MPFVRIVTERLFLLLFWIARSVFLVQGLAMGQALLAASMMSRQGAPSWAEIAWRSSLLIGATLFVTGVLLVVAARQVPASRVDADVRPGWPWPALLGLCLAALPAVAYTDASELFPLWRDVSKMLDDIGFWAGLRESGPYAGIIVIPVLVVLFVPALETITAFFLIAAPLAMIVLLLTRSRLFPKIFAMLIACQAGLVLAGLFAADAFSQVGTEAIAAMTAAPDVEVQGAAEALRRAQGVLAPTAVAFVAPMLGYLAWLPFLLLSRRVGAFFTAGAASAPSEGQLPPDATPPGR